MRSIPLELDVSSNCSCGSEINRLVSSSDQPLHFMILYWFYFSGCIRQDYKNKYLVAGDWSQSRQPVGDFCQL